MVNDVYVAKTAFANSQSILAIEYGDFGVSGESVNGITFVNTTSSFNYASFSEAGKLYFKL